MKESKLSKLKLDINLGKESYIRDLSRFLKLLNSFYMKIFYLNKNFNIKKYYFKENYISKKENMNPFKYYKNNYYKVIRENEKLKLYSIKLSSPGDILVVGIPIVLWLIKMFLDIYKRKQQINLNDLEYAIKKIEKKEKQIELVGILFEFKKRLKEKHNQEDIKLIIQDLEKDLKILEIFAGKPLIK